MEYLGVDYYRNRSISFFYGFRIFLCGSFLSFIFKFFLDLMRLKLKSVSYYLFSIFIIFVIFLVFVIVFS